MKIDKHNCEAVFLDYYEKNLSPMEVAEMLFFLEENPEMKKVFENYEAIVLEHEKINFPDKESIKKKYNAEEINAILSSEINRANCEQFFIANAEGILSSAQKEKLKLFLLQYPELKKEYDLFLQCKLSEEKIAFEEKESLKKELITKENREEYFVRAIENDLNLSEQKALNIFLAKHSEFKKELTSFSQTILTPETISFEDKDSLKKRKRKPVFISIFSQRAVYYAAAAAILLFVGLFFIFRNSDRENKQMFADKANPSNKTVITVKKEKAEAPRKEDEQKTVPQVNNASNNSQQVSMKRKSAIVLQPEIKKEEKQFQPVIFEDEEKFVAENEKPKMMKQEVIAEKKEEPKKENEIIQSPTLASAGTTGSPGNEYQTVGAFARKKVRQVLGIKKSTECETDDKITIWDLAMAGKDIVQKKIGNKVDVDKVCDGKGDSEYVFTAGNFQLARSVSK